MNKNLTAEEKCELTGFAYNNFISFFARRNSIYKNEEGYIFEVYQDFNAQKKLYKSDCYKTISDLDEALINFMDEVAENTDKWY